MEQKPPKKDKFTTLRQCAVAVVILACIYGLLYAFAFISKLDLNNIEFFGLIIVIFVLIFQFQSVCVKILKMKEFYDEVNDIAVNTIRKYLNAISKVTLDIIRKFFGS